MDLKLDQEWLRKRAALEEGRDISAGAPPPTLPTYEQAESRVADGTASALDRFIVDNEPAGRKDGDSFREGLAAVVREAAQVGRG